MLTTYLEDAAALIAIGLFLATIAAWAAIIGSGVAS